MRYPLAFANYDKKVNLLSVMKYNRYKSIGAYKLVTSMCLVFDLKARIKIGKPKTEQ